MGARSVVYFAHYAISALLFLLATILEGVVVVPVLATCLPACGVSISYPQRLLGGASASAACNSSASYSALLAGGCFRCINLVVLAPCPAMTGTCTQDMWVTAPRCSGLLNATSILSGQPIVAVTEKVDSQQCAATMNVSNSGPSVCASCLSAGKCVSGSTFAGPGTYLLSNSPQLCFSESFADSLRSLQLPAAYGFLCCYALLTVVLVVQATVACSFYSHRWRDWAKLGRCMGCMACTFRAMPAATWLLSLILLILLIISGVLLWGFGVCSNAYDAYGQLTAVSTLSSSLILGFAILILASISGTLLRFYVYPDGGLAEPATIDASLVSDKLASEGSAAGSLTACGRFSACLRTAAGMCAKLGP